MCPNTYTDGHDFLGLSRQLIPDVITVIDDVVCRCEHPVREPVVAYELPDVFDQVEFGWARWQQKDGDVGRDHKPVACVPAGLVHQQDSMCVRRHGLRDLGQIQVHRSDGAER